MCPVTIVECAPAFDGDLARQKLFFDQAGISHEESWTSADTAAAHHAWNAYVQARRRAAHTIKRPVADLLIGGFASNRRGLVTRNAADFTRWFPTLDIQEP